LDKNVSKTMQALKPNSYLSFDITEIGDCPQFSGECVDLVTQVMYQRWDFLPYADSSSRITCRRVSSSDSLFELMYSRRAILMRV